MSCSELGCDVFNHSATVSTTPGHKRHSQRRVQTESPRATQSWATAPRTCVTPLCVWNSRFHSTVGSSCWTGWSWRPWHLALGPAPSPAGVCVGPGGQSAVAAWDGEARSRVEHVAAWLQRGVLGEEALDELELLLLLPQEDVHQELLLPLELLHDGFGDVGDHPGDHEAEEHHKVLEQRGTEREGWMQRWMFRKMTGGVKYISV